MNDEAVIAEYYRRYHPLARPKICWCTLFYWIVIAMILLLAVSLIIVFILSTSGLIAWHFFLGFLLRLYAFVTSCFCILFHKRIIILCIELYQHYASEQTRRKCICMPSCSVYATMALKRYNTLKAIYLIINRLSRCRGTIRFIDYP